MDDVTSLRVTSAADLRALGTVLTVWAHPDDETYLAGGLLAGLADAGQRVVCVTATRGEAADPNATAGERAALAALRTEELEAALTMLGVEEHHWLGHPDGGCADLDPDDPVGQLTCLLDDVRPDTVLTFGPDGFTGHPDHRAVSSWATRAAASSSTAPRVLQAVQGQDVVDVELDEEYGVFDLGRPRVCSDDEMAIRLRLDGEVLDRKVAALLRQASQTAGLVQAVGQGRFRAWVAAEMYALPQQLS